MQALEFPNISHDFSVGGVIIMRVEEEPRRVGDTTQNINALEVGVGAHNRDTAEPRFLNK